MDYALFGKGLLLGLAIAAPLGPIGVLCIQRTLEQGFWAGMAGGLGTALADAGYAALAALGLAMFAKTLALIDTPLRLLGGLFLLWLGWQSLRPKPLATAATLNTKDVLGTIAATFALTLSNPLTILSFAAIFKSLGLASPAGMASKGAAFTLVTGVFLGSLAWWLLLSGGITLLQRQLSAQFALWVARLSGAVLIVFGLVSVGSLFWSRTA